MLSYEQMLLHRLANYFRWVCVSLSLSLTIIFPPSSIPCLNLLNNVGFDVCLLLWFFMPFMNKMRIYKLVHELGGEGETNNILSLKDVKTRLCMYSHYVSWVPIDIMARFSCCWKKCDKHLWCNFFVIIFLEFWVDGHMLIYTHDQGLMKSMGSNGNK
jgi:hypothetical protein